MRLLYKLGHSLCEARPLETSVLVEMGLDVDATYGAVFVGGQPLVHALHVEQVHARQASGWADQ